jgi:hypothetical protein
MKLVRLTKYQALTLRNVLESRAGKFTMADLRDIHAAITTINAATKDYAKQAKDAGDEIQKQLKEAQEIADERERALELAAIRETDEKTAKALREGDGATETDVVFETDAFESVLKNWNAVDAWNPAEDVRTVVIAIDDALKAVKTGQYVDGAFEEVEDASPPQPAEIARERKRRRARR